MKKVSFIAILSIMYPKLVIGYTPTITDPNIRAYSYSVEEISQSVYNTAKSQNTSAQVFQMLENGETYYYEWLMPDLTLYNTNVSPTNNRIDVLYNTNLLDDNFFLNYASYGGAVHNGAELQSLSGSFIRNEADNGGAIYNGYNNYTAVLGNINSIQGNFVGNSAADGGAIYNHVGVISSITGNFINNTAAAAAYSYSYCQGGAIYNNGTINALSGTFIGNTISEDGQGGAIYNIGTISELTGDFIRNKIYNTGQEGFGGAIYNNGTIETLSGDFVDNSVKGNFAYGGAIYNSGTIESVRGNFINNSVIANKYNTSVVWTKGFGGAIYNIGTIEALSGSFSGNSTSGQYNADFYKMGAIYNSLSGKINFTDTVNFITSSDTIYNDGIITTEGTVNNPMNLYLQSVYGEGSFMLTSYTNAHVATGKTLTQNNLQLAADSILYMSTNTLDVVSLTNNGLISLTSGTLTQNISNYGSGEHVEISGSVSALADKIDIVTHNNGTLTLSGGTLMNGIAGSGNIIVDGEIVSNVNIMQPTTISDTGSLTISVNNIKNTNLTNSGFLWFSSGILDKNLSNYGNVGNIGSLLADPVYFDQDFTNNGTLTLADGTLLHNITGNGTIITNGFLNINAGYLGNDVINNGTLTLSGGTLVNGIAGSGNIIVDGEIVSNGDMAQSTTINTNASLEISADNIHAITLSNSGLLKLSGGTLSENISTYSNTEISGNVFANANKLDIATTNNGILNITGGTIAQSIVGTGSIVIDGEVDSNVTLTQNTTINVNNSLTTSANNINSNSFINNGILNLTEGMLSKNITGSGNIVVNGIVSSSANHLQQTTSVNSGVLTITGGTLTTNITGDNVINTGILNTSANNIQNTNFINNGTLNLTSGTLTKDISGTGDVNLSNIDVASKHIQIQNSNTTIGGVFALNISNLSENSSEYTGGHLDINGDLVINPNSELRLVIAPSLLANRQTTGELDLISVSGTRTGDFSTLSANNMYTVSQSGSKYIISQGISVKDFLTNITDNQNMINAATAWHNAEFTKYNIQYDVQYLLEYLLQYDEQNLLLEGLDNIIPSEVNIADISFRNVSNSIISQFAERFSNLRLNRRLYGDNYQHKFNIWTQGLFNKSEQTGKTKFDSNLYGITVGAESMLTDNLMLIGGYTYSNTSVTSGAKDIDGDSSIFSLYIEYDVNNLYLNTGISYGIASYEQTTAYENNTDFDSNSLSFNAAIGYNFGVFTPEFRAVYTNTSIDKYTDAAGQNIKYADAKTLSLRPTIKYDNSFIIDLFNSEAKLVSEISAGTIYDIISDDNVVNVDLGTTQYSIYGDSIDPFGITLGINTGLHFGTFEFDLGYDLEYRKDFISHTGKITARCYF